MESKVLRQVNDIHAEGRPDLFKRGKTKYTVDELVLVLENQNTPVFVATDNDGQVVGYCFCVIQEENASNNMQPCKSLYIDDLCVDSSCRGKNVGTQLFEYVRQFALTNGFSRITLNVWSCNPSAMKFYEKIGMTPFKIGMELKL